MSVRGRNPEKGGPDGNLWKNLDMECVGSLTVLVATGMMGKEKEGRIDGRKGQ